MATIPSRVTGTIRTKGFGRRTHNNELGPNLETNYLAGTDVSPEETAVSGGGRVNQRASRNHRTWNRPNKGSVTITTSTSRQAYNLNA